MADNIVAGLFGLTPEMYGEQQRTSALTEGIKLAQLDPAARGAAMTYAGARSLGGAIAGSMGVQDPQLKLISARNNIAQQIDQTNPESIMKGAQMLAQMGDQQGAFALADLARKAQSEMALTQQRLAAGKASLAQASRERVQASPKEVQLARAKAELSGPEGSIEYNTAYAESLNEQMAKPEGKIAYGPEADRAAVAEFGKPFSQLTQAQAKVIDTLLEARNLTKAERGATKVTATASSKGSEEGAKTVAELDAKRLGAAQVSAGKAVEQAGLLQELLKTPQPISGSGAPARVGALRVFSTFGLTSPKDDEALGNADKFNALAGERVISFIKALGSNPTDTDREFARTIGPALEKGTKTNADLINFLLERARKVVKDADAMETHFYDKNYSLRGYKSPFLSDLETPKSKASDLTTEQLQRIARGQKP
jgi:hypothetical protein